MATQTVNKEAAEAAEKLWAKLQFGLWTAEEALIEIINTRAWEALGYESFAKAWVDKMSNVRLATELRAHVVYALFDSGLAPAEVAESVKGITPDAAQDYKRQKDNGIPSTHAKPTTVREHERELPAPPQIIKISIDAALYAEWAKIARRLEMTVSELAAPAAIPAITRAFKKLAQQGD